MRKVIQEIHGVIDVIELNKRSIECQNGKRFLWTVSIFMQTPFPEGGMEIEQSKIDQFQQGGNLKFDSWNLNNNFMFKFVNLIIISVIFQIFKNLIA